MNFFVACVNPVWGNVLLRGGDPAVLKDHFFWGERVKILWFDIKKTFCKKLEAKLIGRSMPRVPYVNSFLINQLAGKLTLSQHFKCRKVNGLAKRNEKIRNLSRTIFYICTCKRNKYSISGFILCCKILCQFHMHPLKIIPNVFGFLPGHLLIFHLSNGQNIWIVQFPIYLLQLPLQITLSICMNLLSTELQSKSHLLRSTLINTQLLIKFLLYRMLIYIQKLFFKVSVTEMHEMALLLTAVKMDRMRYWKYIWLKAEANFFPWYLPHQQAMEASLL